MWQGAYEPYCMTTAVAMLCFEISMYMPAYMGVGCNRCGVLAVLDCLGCMLYTGGTELLQALH